MNLAYILEDSTSAFSDHLLYFLYLSSFVIFLFFLLKYSIQKKSEYNFLVNAHVSIDEVYQILYHNTPPSSTNGWKCVGIFDGCRLWSINKRTISGIPGELISCMSFLTHTPVKDLMDVFLDPREFFEWNFIFGSISQSRQTLVPNSTSKLTEEAVVIDCTVKFILGQCILPDFRCPLNIRFKQFENCAIILYIPERKFICGCIWILFYLNAISHKRGVSEVTTLICTFKYLPFLDHSLPFFKLISSVKDYIYMKQHGAYSSKISLECDPIENTQSKIKPIKSKSNIMDENISASYFQHANDHIYINEIDSKTQQFLQMINDQNGDVWIYVGKSKGIDIWKIDSQGGENSSVTVRGEGTIFVNPVICMRFLTDVRNTPTLDDMFDSAPLVERINRHTQVRNLQYKTIWPLKKRDFCTLLCALHLEPQKWCIVCFSVKHPLCPINEDIVRGNVNAFYLITGSSNNFNVSKVTIVLTIDLKGSVPSWAINRLMTSQPLIIERAKRILESSISTDGSILNQLFLSDEKDSPPFQNSHQTPQNVNQGCDETYSLKYCDASQATICNDSHSVNNVLINEEILLSSLNENVNIENNVLDNLKGDNLRSYRTLATEVHVSVQNELREALRVNIDFNKIVLDYGVSKIGKWQFIGFEKEIVIMRKEFSNKIHGFLGMGVINFPPGRVFEVLRNPQNRFVYDNMLKNINVLQEVDKEMYILRMQHEHNQCFVKQSRESCLLVSESSDGNKYAIVSKSIEHDLCPLSETVKRLQVYKGGWIIEPREKNGKHFSKIYYLIVTELQDVPQFVINHVGKRQPLSIAYLRDFMNQTS